MLMPTVCSTTCPASQKLKEVDSLPIGQENLGFRNQGLGIRIYQKHNEWPGLIE